MSNYLHDGFCPVCQNKVTFISKYSWFRDHLLCSVCGSIPRERALVKVLMDYYPNYRDLVIHETSPGGRGASKKFKKECAQYTASHYYPNFPLGAIHSSGYRCENLECLTFPDNTFDIFISQDVMEHVFDPGKAFKEIARVLKPGGAHIFTVPIINKTKKSERRASINADGEVTYLHQAVYHGNPVDAKGALVTMHWGYDIAAFIQHIANTPTVIIQIDDIDKGIRAEYIDVLVSIRQAMPIGC